MSLLVPEMRYLGAGRAWASLASFAALFALKDKQNYKQTVTKTKTNKQTTTKKMRRFLCYPLNLHSLSRAA